MAAPEYHHAPEVANTTYPEAIPGQHPYQYTQQSQYLGASAPKPEDSFRGSYPTTPYSAQSPQSRYTPAAGQAANSGAGGGKKRAGPLVLILGALIAFLAVAAIGLAAGTGVEASRARSAQNRADQLNASLASALASATSASPSATSTSFAALDNNCSGNADGVTGTTYYAFSLIGDYAFTIQCNKDTTGNSLLKLFTSDFDTCMDACASYTAITPESFGNNTNTTCGAVSFIPLWTNKTAAFEGGAPGNCYLKPSQNDTLPTPNIGTECHAATLKSS